MHKNLLPVLLSGLLLTPELPLLNPTPAQAQTFYSRPNGASEYMLDTRRTHQQTSKNPVIFIEGDVVLPPQGNNTALVPAKPVQLAPDPAAPDYNSMPTYWKAYIEDINEKVKAHWTADMLEDLPSNTATLVLSIHKSGQLLDAKVQQTSGNQAYDQRAKEAVQKAAPFSPLPGQYTADDVTIKFTFHFTHEMVPAKSAPAAEATP